MSSHAMPNVLQKLVAVKKEVAPVNNEVSDPTIQMNAIAVKMQIISAKIKGLNADLSKSGAELILLCGVKEEGTQKFNTEQFTFTTTGKLTRKITDVEVLKKLAPEVVRKKYELDITMLKRLATSNPPLYTKALHCIETKPAKSSIKIEAIKGAA